MLPTDWERIVVFAVEASFVKLRSVAQLSLVFGVVVAVVGEVVTMVPVKILVETLRHCLGW